MNKFKTFSSLVCCKCPRCRRGNLFEVQNPYNLLRFFMMPDNCGDCGHKFEMEPGFWYGAMYFSYLLGVVFLLPVVIVLFWINIDFLTGIVVVSCVLVLLIPVLFRYSRTLWIYIFVPYDRDL